MHQKILALSQTNANVENMEVFISSHYDKIYKYCYSMLRNVEDAQDEQLQHILNQLKPDESALIVFRIIEHYSFDEIAAIIDKPAPTIRKRYERLKEKINQVSC
ncbi:sigma-70 region 4 domain-containing protein [Solibacillus sp. FSL H8-0523]|uniref:RNA polymerase sigma factor n=1 Tax=Solibacillus sp. FSL H8-0523 TaxID=2954511 RepID=UPI003100CE58